MGSPLRRSGGAQALAATFCAGSGELQRRGDLVPGPLAPGAGEAVGDFAAVAGAGAQDRIREPRLVGGIGEVLRLQAQAVAESGVLRRQALATVELQRRRI